VSEDLLSDTLRYHDARGLEDFPLLRDLLFLNEVLERDMSENENVLSDEIVGDVAEAVVADSADPDVPDLPVDENTDGSPAATEPTAAESEAARRRDIKRGMAGNAADKEHCKRETNAGRRDPRSDNKPVEEESSD